MKASRATIANVQKTIRQFILIAILNSVVLSIFDRSPAFAIRLKLHVSSNSTPFVAASEICIAARGHFEYEQFVDTSCTQVIVALKDWRDVVTWIHRVINIQRISGDDSTGRAVYAELVQCSSFRLELVKL